VDNCADQLDAAAAGAELVELELEPLEDEDELDVSEDEELLLVLDSALPPEPLEELDELLAAALADSRLSVR
jgi:hypothetical protein